MEVTPRGSVLGTCCIPSPVLLLGIQLSLPGCLVFTLHRETGSHPVSAWMNVDV